MAGTLLPERTVSRQDVSKRHACQFVRKRKISPVPTGAQTKRNQESYYQPTGWRFYDGSALEVFNATNQRQNWIG